MAVGQLEKHDMLALPFTEKGHLPVRYPSQHIVVQSYFRSGLYSQRNATLVQFRLEAFRQLAYPLGTIFIAPGMHMRGHGCGADSGRNGVLR